MRRLDYIETRKQDRMTSAEYEAEGNLGDCGRGGSDQIVSLNIGRPRTASRTVFTISPSHWGRRRRQETGWMSDRRDASWNSLLYDFSLVRPLSPVFALS